MFGFALASSFYDTWCPLVTAAHWTSAELLLLLDYFHWLLHKNLCYLTTAVAAELLNVVLDV